MLVKVRIACAVQEPFEEVNVGRFIVCDQDPSALARLFVHALPLFLVEGGDAAT